MAEDKFILSGPSLEKIPAGMSLSFADYIMERLKEGGKAIAQVCNQTGVEVTYEEIREKSLKLAMILQKNGIKKGDVVAISSESRFEFTVTSIAVMLLGASVTTLNIFYSKSELIHTMTISKPMMIFCSSISLGKIMEAMDDIPSLKRIVFYGDEKPNPSIVLYKELFAQQCSKSSYKPVKLDDKDYPVAILCSSGTTGLPKCVVLTHNNFIVNSLMFKTYLADEAKSGGSVLLFVPWFHGYGFISHLMCLCINIKSYFMTKFDKEAYMSSIEKNKITVTMLVPPIMVMLAKDPLVDKYDFSSLKEIWCGAAPLSKDVHMAVTKRIGVKNIYQGYGMTETTYAVLHSKNHDIRYGASGKLIAGIKAKVVDLETGKSLGPNKEGELHFKGDIMMHCYMNNKKATEDMIDKDGWLRTGDIGYYDEDGYFFIVDRLKELIKYKGFQVAPAELEDLLLQHSAIKDVGVVGLPDEVAGELPLAFVVLQPDAIITDKDIIDFVAKEVSHPKRLHGGIRFLAEIPKNPSGKILRRELRQLLKK